ncbi:oxidase ustYa family protein [Aspergillus brunneoviolaceus CBS 621.78]|uniref:Uncharacterized protein n=1 Tax=Aspergillus brunneoviolaceus CBS 621.78 TaxID=1450534 RepID=A0ACD1GA92_9EURO|nr:hypothetical protein BO95DRAFT_463232 [Aspergillus brunneoviolaceus CBS 621.78]RAH46182.1 hypothetical protein BO95DRAFT_463232 [Aspergillus brunneoviolaceus CBS 621.78]
MMGFQHLLGWRRTQPSRMIIPTSDEDGEEELFLPSEPHEKRRFEETRPEALPWMISTFTMGACLLVLLLLAYPASGGQSYEVGYATEMQAAIPQIELERVRFWGGIKADENGTFYMHFNPADNVRYVGKPTRELDAAWDRLAGQFIPLTQEESESVEGDISEHDGIYLAATAVQHSLHCLNYLRQAIYDDYYPSIHEIRPHIPEYWLHVDHCIETLRQEIQCAGDLTPVPKVWNEHAGQLLADIEATHTCRKFERILEWTESR